MQSQIADFIQNAIREDIGDGDHSSLACIPGTAQGKMQLLAKQEGIVAGIEVAKQVFTTFDPDTIINVLIADGTPIQPGDVILTVEGKVLALLGAERLVLNIVQRMSGVATQTNEYVKRLDGLKTRVLDTRKTTPGMRVLDKAAVKLGGGVNHRIGLYDMVMLKDNHIDFAGGIEPAIRKVHEYLKSKGKDLEIEVEARNMDEIKQIMAVGGIHRIMLDNFSIQETKEAVALINGQYETESSGGITLGTLRSYAECGVDYISVGALTHQIKSLDLSLKAMQ